MAKEAAVNGVKAIEVVNSEEVRALVFANVNGTTYFGKITEDGDKVKIESAIIVYGGGTKDAVKAWLKANNRGTLSNPKVGGQISYNIEPMNESQLMEVDQLISSVNMKLKYAFVDIANDIIEAE